jgi:thiol-disulfide isomerase/thioredoxin
MENLLAVLALVASTTMLGLAYQLLHGRGHRVKSGIIIELERLSPSRDGQPTTKLGERATLLQFSNSYCGRCSGVRRQLSALGERKSGLHVLEVDITDRLDVAANFGINQTPTVFLLGAKGELVYRVGGIPNLVRLSAELEKLGVK